MTEIARLRLRNQHLGKREFVNPADEVRWLGAVQAQDYPAAKWALGLRTGQTDSQIEAAFNRGDFLRTHVMRPTWHFVHPEDIRWMLELTAPRVEAISLPYFRKLELDEALIKKSAALVQGALMGGNQLTRDELGAVLRTNGIVTDGPLRLGYIMFKHEIDRLICSGPRKGKQFTYMLLEERVPAAKQLTREEALAELTYRFFASHGPATPHDFAKWSGLTVTDARKGLEANTSRLTQGEIDGRPLAWDPSSSSATPTKPEGHLLPNYDEYTVGYANHRGVFEAELKQLIFNHTIVLDGWVIGTWKRTLAKSKVAIEANTFQALGPLEHEAIEEAAKRYAAFLGLTLELTLTAGERT